MRALRLCLLATVMAVSAFCAAGEVTAKEADFVKKTWIANHADFMMGKLAEKRGSSKFVRQFGTMMSKHHKTANEDLTQLAKSEMIELPTKLDERHQTLYAKLSKLRGSAFDRAYKAAMFKGHREAYDMLVKCRQEAENSNVKNYATRYEPIVALHLKALQSGKLM